MQKVRDTRVFSHSFIGWQSCRKLWRSILDKQDHLVTEKEGLSKVWRGYFKDFFCLPLFISGIHWITGQPGEAFWGADEDGEISVD